MLIKLLGIFQAFSPQSDCNVKVLLGGKRSIYIHLIFHLLIPESLCAIPLGMLIQNLQFSKEGESRVASIEQDSSFTSHIRSTPFLFSCLKCKSESD